MKKQFITVITLFISGCSILAQTDTTINKNVIVVKEYNPTISDANKINLLPEIVKPEVKTPVFDYSFFTNPIETAFEIVPLSPATLSREPKRSYDQNYVRIGLGNYSSLYGELFYNAFQSDKHSLTFLARNKSAFGNVKLQDGSKPDATFVRNDLLLSYKRQFWGSYFKTDLNFSNHNYRYYGFQTAANDPAVNYYHFGDTNNVMVNSTDIQGIDKPGYASFKANFLLATNPSLYDEMAYKAELYYDHFFTRMDLTQDVIGLDGFFKTPLGDNMAGANLNIETGFYGTPDDTTRYKGFNNYTYVGFSPWLIINGNAWNLKLGINTFTLFSDKSTNFLVTPDLALNFNLIENFFTAHLLAGGNYQLNDYRKVISYNPYISPELSLTPTSTPLMLEAGLKGQLTPKIVFNGSVNFSIIENKPFFINTFLRDSVTQISSATYTNQFVAEYDDVNLLTVKAAIDYSGNDTYSFGVSGAYFNYSPDNLENVWHLPEYEINVYSRFIPYPNIKVNFNFKTIGRRDALTQIGDVTVVDELKPVYDLSLGGEYRYNNRITAYVNLNNLLASKYYTWNGYPSFGFNAMVGLKYKF